MGDGDLLVVGMPVYSGRIPASALPALRKFRGNGTPAVVVCVYGNRDYDDALLELTDVVGENGFRVAAAAAFVAQHSIFPQVGTNRPDEEDIRRIAAFVRQFRRKIDSAADSASLQEVVPPGGRPYKTPGKVPLRPTGGRQVHGVRRMRRTMPRTGHSCRPSPAKRIRRSVSPAAAASSYVRPAPPFRGIAV